MRILWPLRVIRIAEHRFRLRLREALLSAPWSPKEGLNARQYRSYDEYVRHQASKLSAVGHRRLDSGMDRRLRAELVSRMRQDILPGNTVLCLAARRGGEVLAFRDLGASAIGVDLNPGPSNPVVIPADFHALPVRAASVDRLYTNSLDHAFDLPRLLNECRRVLRPHGILLVDAAAGHLEHTWATTGSWESISWPTLNELVFMVEACGWLLVNRSSIRLPHEGECLRFKKRV